MHDYRWIYERVDILVSHERCQHNEILHERKLEILYIFIKLSKLFKVKIVTR